MRVIICGSRYWTDEDTIHDYIKTLPPNSTIIHGDCRGADRIAARLGKIHGHEVIPMAAKWNLHGDAAGPIRNGEMLREGRPELVVAFHNDIKRSVGTADMLRQAEKAGVPTRPLRSKY